MRLPSIVAFLTAAFLTVAVPLAAPDVFHSTAQARETCGTEYYLNVDGRCVHRPLRAPRVPVGASARCRDGSYSFSKHRRGTCSRHGGVAEWL